MALTRRNLRPNLKPFECHLKFSISATGVWISSLTSGTCIGFYRKKVVFLPQIEKVTVFFLGIQDMLG